MSSHSKTTIAGQLNAARLAISNTRADAEIHMLVAVYGYDDAMLDAGQRLYETAIAAVNAAAAAAGAQRHAVAQADAAEQQAHASYQALAQLCRAVFAPGAAQRTTLGLIGNMPVGIPAFLTAATTLFENALAMSAIAHELERYGYTARRLAGERDTIAEFERANREQIAATSAAQQATREQRAAMIALKQWVAQYLKIAKIALRGKPELVEKLGGVARTSRTAAQRAAPKKAAATRAAKLAA